MHKGVQVRVKQFGKNMKMYELHIFYLTRTTSELFAPSSFGQHLHNN